MYIYIFAFLFVLDMVDQQFLKKIKHLYRYYCCCKIMEAIEAISTAVDKKLETDCRNEQCGTDRHGKMKKNNTLVIKRRVNTQYIDKITIFTN